VLPLPSRSVRSANPLPIALPRSFVRKAPTTCWEPVQPTATARSRDVSATGAYLAVPAAWTGATNSNIAGMAANTCDGWNGTSANVAYYGDGFYADTQWFSGGQIICTASQVSRSLYCLEQ
jgi:hypothetical protein